MARWMSSRRRRLRRYYRRKYRRRYKKRAVNLTSRSRISVRIPVTKTVSLTVPANSKQSNVICFSPVLDFRSGETYAPTTDTGYIWSHYHLDGGLMYHPLYTNYAALYDEMKIDRMTVRGVIQTPVGAGQDFESVSVFTAWNRNFDKNDFGAEYPTITSMRDLSTYQQAIAVNNTVNKFMRSLAAGDLLERISFVDASPWPVQSSAPAFTVSEGAGITHTTATNTVKPLVAYHGSQGLEPKFQPTFFFGINAGVASSTDRIAVCQVQIMYTVTFRTPKFGASASASRDSFQPLDVRRQSVSSDSSLMTDGSNASDAAAATLPPPHDPQPSAAMVRQDPLVTDGVTRTSKRAKNV